MDNTEFVASLRAAADFFESHPEAPVPSYRVTLNMFVYTREEFESIARSVGTANKGVSGEWFFLRRKFGDCLQMDWNVTRGEVCEARVVGKRVIPARPAEPEREVDIVEWDCRPLLGGQGGEPSMEMALGVPPVAPVGFSSLAP